MGKAKKTGLLLLAILIALFVLLPLVWMLSTAFKMILKPSPGG